MVDTALSGLPALTGAGLANSDLFLVTDVSAGTAGSKKMTAAEQLIGLLSIGDAYQFGGADAAAPDAQVLSAQSVLAGTSNVAGAALTIRGSRGTGTGAGGDIIFNVAPAGSAGSAQNALRDTFKLGADGRTWVGYSGGSVFASLEADAANNLVINNYAGFAWAMVHAGGFNIRGDGYLGFGSGAASAGGDTKLWRDASNTFAQRNGATAQALRIFNTWTNASNGEWLEFGFASNVPYIYSKANGTGTQQFLALGAGATQLSLGTNGVYIANALRLNWGAPNCGIVNGLSSGGASDVLSVISSTMWMMTWSAYGPNIVMAGSAPLGWSSNATDSSLGSFDTSLARLSAGIIGFRSGATGAALNLLEQTAPAAPAVNQVSIYAEDNGSGKTRLMARFNTGAAVQVAIEP